jgi:hypothetical protein
MLAGLFVSPRLAQPDKTLSQRAEWLEMRLAVCRRESIPANSDTW